MSRRSWMRALGGMKAKADAMAKAARLEVGHRPDLSGFTDAELDRYIVLLDALLDPGHQLPPDDLAELKAFADRAGSRISALNP